jgi:hypothetical protein
MRIMTSSRNVIICVALVALAVGAILGAIVGIAYQEEPVTPLGDYEVDEVVEDAVYATVLRQPPRLPDEFKAALRSLGTVAVAFVGGDPDATLTAVTIGGTAIDLCAPDMDAPDMNVKMSDRSCKLRITTRGLMRRLNASTNCGLCGGLDDYDHECHRTGTRKGKYDCHGSAHTKCINNYCP